MLGLNDSMSLNDQKLLSPLRWYLAQLKPSGLISAERNLARQGFASFCPLQRMVKTEKKLAKLVDKPLFPGYLFINFDPATSPWRKINSTYGVAKLVTFGLQAPMPVPMGLVSGLKSRCDEFGHLLPPRNLKKGEKVRVLSGPFSDFITTIDQVSDDQRIWVLLDLMGRQTRVAMEAEMLEKA